MDKKKHGHLKFQLLKAKTSPRSSTKYLILIYKSEEGLSMESLVVDFFKFSSAKTIFWFSKGDLVLG